MLSETDAYALLARHCGPVTKPEWVYRDARRHWYWADAVRERVDVIFRTSCSSSEREDVVRDRGAHLRLALGVALAVSCCRGFAPETNRAFWSRVVATLWFEFMPLGPGTLAMSPTAFAHVGLHFYDTRLPPASRNTRNGVAFWRGFLYGTEASVVTLAAVHEALAPHWRAGRPPPLRVSLSRCDTADPTWPPNEWPAPIGFSSIIGPIVTPDALRSLLRAVVANDTVSQWPVTTIVGLVVSYRIDMDPHAVRNIMTLMARVRDRDRLVPRLLGFPVDRLVIELSAPKPPHIAEPGPWHRHAFVARVRALGALLRAALLDGATPRVRCVALNHCSYCDVRLVGAALSAVAHATPPMEELRCHDMLLTWEPRDLRQRLGWLVYALQRCRGNASMALSLFTAGIAIDAQECSYLQQLMTDGTPLRDAVTMALRLQNRDQTSVTHVPLGETVQLKRGTRLFVEPGCQDGRDVAVTTDNDATLDIVAHATGLHVIGVVVPGYGLLWADVTTVRSWRHQPFEKTIHLGALALHFEVCMYRGDAPLVAPHRVAATVALVASDLVHTLTLRNCLLLDNDLALVLASCPRLRTLALDHCVVENLALLSTAPHLSALSLVCVGDLCCNCSPHGSLWSLQSVAIGQNERTDLSGTAWVTPLLDTLVTGDLRLHDLSVDLTDAREVRPFLETLARIVARHPRSLARLHVACKVHEWSHCVEILEPLRNAGVIDVCSVRMALVSVLRTAGCALPEVAHAVLAWAGGVTRTVTWGGGSG